MILYCIDSLKKGLDSLKKMTRVKNYSVDATKQHLDKMLKSFEEAVSQPLPTLPKKEFTELDKHIRKLRVQEWEALHNDCRLMPINQLLGKIEEYIERLKRMAEVQNLYWLLLYVLQMVARQ